MSKITLFRQEQNIGSMIHILATTPLLAPIPIYRNEEYCNRCVVTSCTGYKTVRAKGHAHFL